MEAQNQPAADDGFAPDYAPAMLYNVLSEALCAQTIDVAERLGFSASSVYSQGGGEENRVNVRNSGSVYLAAADHAEVYGYMSSVVQKMNRSLYRFQLTGLEPIQILRYEAGGFFTEHVDLDTRRTASRKLSVIVQLSDGGDYAGGDVTLFGGVTVPRTRGFGIVFPSWVPHRVHEITGGRRYALVTWAVGNHFV